MTDDECASAQQNEIDHIVSRERRSEAYPCSLPLLGDFSWYLLCAVDSVFNGSALPSSGPPDDNGCRGIPITNELLQFSKVCVHFGQ